MTCTVYIPEHANEYLNDPLNHQGPSYFDGTGTMYDVHRKRKLLGDEQASPAPPGTGAKSEGTETNAAVKTTRKDIDKAVDHMEGLENELKQLKKGLGDKSLPPKSDTEIKEVIELQ